MTFPLPNLQDLLKTDAISEKLIVATETADAAKRLI